jgi:hypothetical protein
MWQSSKKAPRHFVGEAVTSRPVHCDFIPFCLGAGPRRGSRRIVKTYKKAGFFANETHSQMEIVRLTDASSAAT